MEDATSRAVEKFLAYFSEIQRYYADASGKPLEMYKQTDPDCLAAVFEALWRSETRGAEFIGGLVNALSWGQCLGNGNHRTTILFVQSFLNSANVLLPHYAAQSGAEARFGSDVDYWTNKSQALIRRRGEPGYAQARLAPAHEQLTKAWVAEMLGTQSAVLATIGPQRLMNFVSSSERTGGGAGR